MWNHPWQEVIEGQIVPMFNKSSTSVVVQPTLVVGDTKSTPEQKVIASIAGGTPPDIMTEWNKVLPTWADKGVITALEPLLAPADQAPFKEWFWPIAYQIGQYQGHQYGAPSTMNSWAMVWNKQLFQQAGLDPEQGPKDHPDAGQLRREAVQARAGQCLHADGLLSGRPLAVQRRLRRRHL